MKRTITLALVLILAGNSHAFTTGGKHKKKIAPTQNSILLETDTPATTGGKHKKK